MDRRRRLQVARSFRRKIRRLPDNMVARGQQGTGNGREETMTGTGTRAGTETTTRAGIGTRTRMGAKMGAGTGTMIEKRVEEIGSLETYEVVIGVGWETREGGDSNE